MKKFFMTSLSMLLLVVFSSFVNAVPGATGIANVNAGQRSFDTFNVGYFWANGQEYHAYGDNHGNIVEIWTVNNFLNDVTQVTIYSGYWFNYIDGRYNLNVGFYDTNDVYQTFVGISHFYPGIDPNP